MEGKDKLEIRKFRAKEWALAQTKKKQLLPSEKPSGEIPGLPERISEMEDSELGDLHAQIIGWLSYAYGQLALADIDNTCAKRIKEHTQSRVMLNPTVREEFEGKTTLLKAYSSVHKESQQIIFEAELTYSLYTMMKSKVAELEVYKEAASREISRRDAESRRRLSGG